MVRISILLTCLILMNSGHIIAQRTVSGTSDKGLLYPENSAPKLEARVINLQNKTNTLFRGAFDELDLMVYNKGDVTARECMIIIGTDSQYIRPKRETEFFDVQPGDSFRIKLSFAVSQYIEPGPVRITIEIEALHGYNLYPPRTVNYFVKEKPEQELTIVDVGVQDRLGLGYFDKFEDVGLYFRVQNCSASPIDNIVAYMDLHEGTIPISINPELKIGRLEPGETYDIYANVETGITANNIGVHLNMESDQAGFSQNFVFEFMGSYKTPERMVSDGCGEFHPQVSAGYTDLTENKILTSKPPQDNKIAIIISNETNLSLDKLEYAHGDAFLFKHTLISQMGYREENVFHYTNIFYNPLINLFELNGIEYNPLRRTLRQSRRELELTIFYVGYGAADLHNGEIYLLPWEFNSYNYRERYPIMRMFENLRIWKNNYNIGNINTYLNINYALLSKVGLKNEQKFKIAEFHESNSGFTTFISSSVHQLTNQHGHSTSPFTTLLVEGLQGRADLNQDQTISAEELYRFLSDEYLGLPPITWETQRSFQVPVVFGEDVILF